MFNRQHEVFNSERVEGNVAVFVWGNGEEWKAVSCDLGDKRAISDRVRESAVADLNCALQFGRCGCRRDLNGKNKRYKEWCEDCKYWWEQSASV